MSEYTDRLTPSLWAGVWGGKAERTQEYLSNLCRAKTAGHPPPGTKQQTPVPGSEHLIAPRGQYLGGNKHE